VSLGAVAVALFSSGESRAAEGTELA